MAEIDSEFIELFKFLAAQIPEMVAAFLGIVVCCAQWRRHPRPALLGFLAFGLMLVASIGGISVIILGQRWYPDVFSQDGLPAYVVWGIRSLLIAVGFLLALWAIFAGRTPAVSRPPLVEGDPRRDM